MGQNRMAERLQGRSGKFDTVYFKTDDDRIRRALKHFVKLRGHGNDTDLADLGQRFPISI